ncbi:MULTISPECIES: hypothetical protein [unclassified Microcoleus]|uniref:hypothetical protein n=1 Tax=unclassified Microcoleus TaxID=2642155 RepID=UPI002FD74CE4
MSDYYNMKPAESAIGDRNFQFWVPSGNLRQKVFVIVDILHFWRYLLGFLRRYQLESRDFSSLLPG